MGVRHVTREQKQMARRLKSRRFREVSGFEGKGRVRHSGSRWRS